jgi:AcrR family transcriptional regulator
VRDICGRAGVNVAAVNYHFGDKEKLYLETVRRAYRERADAVPMPDWPAGMTAEDKLRVFIHTLLSRLLKAPADDTGAHLILRELAHPSEACQQFVREYVRPHFEMLLSILDELVPAEVPLEARHMMAFSIVGQCVYYLVAEPVVKLLVEPDEYRDYQVDRLAEHIVTFSLAALATLAARAKGQS